MVIACVSLASVPDLATIHESIGETKFPSIITGH